MKHLIAIFLLSLTFHVSAQQSVPIDCLKMAFADSVDFQRCLLDNGLTQIEEDENGIMYGKDSYLYGDERRYKVMVYISKSGDSITLFLMKKYHDPMLEKIKENSLDFVNTHELFHEDYGLLTIDVYVFPFAGISFASFTPTAGPFTGFPLITIGKFDPQE